MRKALCFAGGTLLAFTLLLCAVLIPALSTQRFEAALHQTVNPQTLKCTPDELTAFAGETMQYLRGEKGLWTPAIPREGPSEAFSIHMAEVRGWVSAAPWLVAAGLLVGAGMLWMGGLRRGFALLGVLAAVGLLGITLLWALVDFDSFWMILHRVLIPGGIFSAYEPVMQLFPIRLFMCYLMPVSLWAVGLLGGLCAVLGIDVKKCKGRRT